MVFWIFLPILLTGGIGQAQPGSGTELHKAQLPGSEKLAPFGLEGKIVTCLASYGGALYAGTDGDGIYVRQLSDSEWTDWGLQGVHILSIYPHDIGPVGWGITVGAQPEIYAGDSTLTYCWSTYNPAWTASDSGFDHSRVYWICSLDGFPDPRICGETFAGGSTGVYRRTLGGHRWEQVLDMYFGTAFAVRVDQEQGVVWAAGGETCIFEPWIARSYDKGTTWQITYPPFIYPSNRCYSLAFHPAFPAILYAGMDGTVIKTTDGGLNWKLTNLRDNSVSFTSLASDWFDPQHIWAGGSKGVSPTRASLWESFDGGENWQQIVSIRDSNIRGIADLVSDPHFAGVVYLATLGNGVWRYESARPTPTSYFPLQIGNRWTFSETLTETITDTVRIADSLYFHFSQFRHIGDALLRLTYDNKLLVGNNQTQQVWVDFAAAVGDTWVISSPEGHPFWTVSLESKTDTVVVPAGTFTNCYRFWFHFHGRDNDWVEWYAPGLGPVKRILYGFAQINYPLTSAWVNGVGYPTRVITPPEVSLPEQFYLYPNYPNPFHTSTLIRYDLLAPAQVTLEIYNLLGQKVRTLVTDWKSAGRYQALWDGCEEAGRALPSGVYLYRLEVGGVMIVKKMLLLR